MESSNTNDNEIEIKIKNIYSLAALFIFCSSLQWFLLNCFELYEFKLNLWVLSIAFITLSLTIAVYIYETYTESDLPEPLRWIFGIAFVEIVVIIFSPMITSIDTFSLLISLPFIVLCMALLLMLGSKIDLQILPLFVVVINFSNLLLLLLLLTLTIIAKFFVIIYTIVFCIILALAVPILLMNTIYVSMLITYNRYEPKTLTDCLKPALYIYGIFAALVWFCLELEIELK